MKANGAEIVIKTLISHGVTDIFGYPGGCVLNIYDEIYKAGESLNHILTCHEQGASHVADGYARATGKTGVVIATSGPGATNLVTGIASAYLDSTPLVAITGNVDSKLIGKDSFQEVDIAGITMPVTKHNYIVKDVNELEETLCEAFRIARSGRKGPVLIDIPKDVQAASCEFHGGLPLPLYDNPVPDDTEIEKITELVKSSERPFIYVGGGVVSAEAEEILAEFAELIDAPAGFSMMGLSAMDYKNPRKLGMTGMHGVYAASVVQSEADLIIGVGVRFSDRATGNIGKYTENAKVIHIDIDRAEIGKNVAPDLSAVGEIKETLTRIVAKLKAENFKQTLTSWNERVTELVTKQQKLFDGSNRNPGDFTPRKIIKAVREYTEDNTPVATDVGQHQMWTAMNYDFGAPRTFITSGGLGTMGFGLGAAMGAAVGTGKRAVLITGDGGFHMNMNELATAVTYKIPVVIVIINNGVLGLVRQWQRQFYGERFSNTTLHRKTDYVKLADAFGAVGFLVKNEAELRNALDKAFEVNDGPVVIDCHIDMDEKVLPMIPPGGSIHDLIIK